MKKTIAKKIYDTDKAAHLGFRYVGEFGHDDGYEEQLFLAKDGSQHFLYGVGGPGSAYAEPEIRLMTKKEADAWLKENGAG